MAPKRRPVTGYFDSGDLATALGHLAQLRNPGFKWSGESYSSSRRGLAPNKAELKAHEPALRALLGFAKSGLPSHKNLMSSFMLLHQAHGVFDPSCDLETAASKAADRWRIMTKDCYVLAKEKYDGDDLRDLLGIMDITTTRPDESQATESSTSVGGQDHGSEHALDASQRDDDPFCDSVAGGFHANLGDEGGDDDDIIVTKVVCWCWITT